MIDFILIELSSKDASSVDYSDINELAEEEPVASSDTRDLIKAGLEAASQGSSKHGKKSYCGK